MAQFQPLPQSIPSPNMASLGTFQNIPVSHYTGAPVVNVPLYTMQYRDLTLPIELSYHPAGIKPEVIPGWVGMGWNLMSGGSITRELRGAEDEDPQIGFFLKYGVLAAGDWSSSSKLLSMAFSVDDEFQDVFSFSVNGYSGEFLMNHWGQWEVISDHEILIEFDFVSDIMSFDGHPMIRKFVLVMPDGLRYTFGGSMNEIEFSYQFWSSKRIANTWHLTRVESPVSGATINFSYGRGSGLIGIGSLIGEILVNIPKSAFARQVHAASDGSALSPSCSEATIPTLQQSVEVVSPVYLKEITYSDMTLRFHRSASNALYYPIDEIQEQLTAITNEMDNIRHFSNNGGHVKPMKLDSISVLHNGLFVRSFRFQYNHGVAFSGNQHQRPRLILTQVIEKGREAMWGGAYSFEYNNNATLIVLNNFATDHWGFFNNNPVTPLAVASPTYHNSREPNASVTTTGVLTRITFPTKGYADLEWEANEFGASVPLRRTDPLVIHAAKRVAGGPRIRRILFTDPVEGRTHEKLYYYVKNYVPGAPVSTLPSSGVLLTQAQYSFVNFQARSSFNSGTIITYTWHNTNSQVPTYDYLRGAHVGYSEVVEVTPGNGYTIYKYSNYDNGHGDEAPINTLDVTAYAFQPYTSKANERGKLLQMVHYNENGAMITREVLEYQDLSGTGRFIRFFDSRLITLCDLHSIVLATARKKYSYKYLLKKKTTYEYFSGNEFVNEVRYVYNSRSQVVEEQHHGLSQNEIIVVRNKYASDYSLVCADEFNQCRDFCRTNSANRAEMSDCLNGCDADFQTCVNSFGPTSFGTAIWQMVKRNMVALPIETTRHITLAGVTKTTSGQIVEYGFNTTLQRPLPTTVHELMVSRSILAFEQSSINPTTFQLSSDVRYGARLQIVRYNEHGQVSEFVDEGGIRNVLVWGYDSRNPVLRVKNATFDAVAAGLGAPNLSLLTSPTVTKEQVLSIGEALRAAMPGIHVEADAHDPFYGLVSRSDVNGIPTTFDYDGLGRLRTVRDFGNNVVQHYYYAFRR